MKTVPGEPLRWNLARLGDPAALSLTTTYLYLPFGLVGPVLIDPLRFGGGLASWLIVGAAGQLVVMVGFAAARRLVHRGVHEGSRPWATAVAVSATATLRGVVLAATAQVLGLTTVLEAGYRILAGVTAQTAMLLILGVLVSSYEYHRRVASELQQHKQQLELLDRTMRERLIGIHDVVVADVHQSIDPLMDELDLALARMSDAGSSDEVCRAIQRMVDEELRPLSHSLASPVQRDVLAGLSVAVRDSGRIPVPHDLPLGRLLQPFAVGVFTALLAASQSVRDVTPIAGIVFPIVVAVGVMAMLVLARLLVGRVRALWWLGVLVAVGITSFAYGATVQLAVFSGLPAPGNLAGATWAAGGIVGAATAMYVVVNERRQATEVALRDSIDALETRVGLLRQGDFVERRRASLMLHGSIQSALHAAALRIGMSTSLTRADVEEIRTTIAAAAQRLDAPASPYVRLVETLAEIAGTWEGACHVRWSLDHRTVGALATAPVAASCVAELARETVGNAVRHGKASEVSLRIHADGDRIIVTCLDNGRGFVEGWEPGLGLKMIEDMCLDWSRDGGESGVTVTATLAVDNRE